MIDWKTGDRVNAGFAGGESCPVVGLADAKRCHHPDTGDGHDRPAHVIVQIGHAVALDRLSLRHECRTPP